MQMLFAKAEYQFSRSLAISAHALPMQSLLLCLASLLKILIYVQLEFLFQQHCIVGLL